MMMHESSMARRYRGKKRSRHFAGFILLDGAIAEGQVIGARAELQRAAGGESRAFFQCAQLGRLLFVVAGQPGQDIALVIAGLDQWLARQVAGTLSATAVNVTVWLSWSMPSDELPASSKAW
ncbi:hypothetical protein VM57_10040 [Stenotrophomonas maltophilia]|uniref:Uncharacterized protein n=1 Tax=Stenotrophomonas maltophilia TaxID=40324 RepID=A0A0F5ZNL3_STEMA|nr:hypothetical protein VM57_10040 [Stenotrophomonas maltophilia]